VQKNETPIFFVRTKRATDFVFTVAFFNKKTYNSVFALFLGAEKNIFAETTFKSCESMPNYQTDCVILRQIFSLTLKKLFKKMKKSFVRNFLVLVALTTLFGACQRGSGCPYKFEAKSEVRK
jgi:hypothetical protein